MPKSKKNSSTTYPFESIHQAIEEQIAEDDLEPPINTPAMATKNYRKAALQHYTRHIEGVHLHVCVMCGFGIKAILEVAHLSQDRSDNTIDNLAVLCPNCHKMHDIGLIPSDVIRRMRDYKPALDWKLRIKDAGSKAAATRKLKASKNVRSVAAKKAAATRKGKTKAQQI